MKEIIKGVITGDIVGSTFNTGGERAQLLSGLQTIANDISELMPLKMELFRGDSFQIVADDPEDSVKIAVLFRAALKGLTPAEARHLWDARVAVGIGTVDYESERIGLSDGEAFRLSGRELDSIGKKRLVVTTPWSEINDELSVSTSFADDIITAWTRVQAEITYWKIAENKAQKEIAEQFGRTPQNISKILGASKENLICQYLTRCRNLILNKISAL
ncbi:MAG: SatD family protein [Duncaniella sp.]|uniref:hypothetical protein n=1 Tax=Duncaniella sp. TaxID=2518496 RepID=UPI0023CFAE68|nr:hypothetical protein [Duncaniella sp.]MDE5989149.1 SatD family protein [Duncaniella sp.]